RADAVIRTDYRAERRGGVAELKGQRHFLFHGQTEAAVLLGNRKTKQTELAHLLDDCGRNRVRRLDLVLGRDQALPHESTDGFHQTTEKLFVSYHSTLPPRAGITRLISFDAVLT